MRFFSYREAFIFYFVNYTIKQMWLCHLITGEIAWHQPQSVQMKKVMVFVPKNERTFRTAFWDVSETECLTVEKAPLKF